VPQRRFNVLGRGTPVQGLVSISTSLNDTAGFPLSVGPDRHRPAGPGDFNAEFDWYELRGGGNRVAPAGWDDESRRATSLRAVPEFGRFAGGEMNESSSRMTDPGNPPDDSAIADWIGKENYQYWKLVTQLIEQAYPNVFAPEWLFGGKKHGWSLRYKKNRSFCTLIPERNRFALLIVFGTEERTRIEAIKNSISRNTQREYDEATTYHDGKWLLLTVDSDKVVEDIMFLLAVKRKPKHGRGA
jgi:hypothetical protein